MKKQSCEEEFPEKSVSKETECWLDDACILDMDYFVKTLSAIKQKGVRSDLIASIITHYASKWLGPDHLQQNTTHSPETVTTSWLKKRFFVETLVGVLPPDKDSIPCSFLLRLLRTANMVSVDATYRAELENRISWQLNQASLKELLIPSFSQTCGTLLDVDLVLRLVKSFLSFDHHGPKTTAAGALVKVAKLVDSYLAEAAVDANLSLSQFVSLAEALPSHARATDDGLYRAIDTYLKAHPSVSKQERKGLCRLIDSRKLTTEASLHAAQNERLPVRAVIQVLFSEQTKLNRHIDWSGSFSSLRSPNNVLSPPTRCLSKREMNAQQMEIRNLKEDVHRLQKQCNAMQMQMERMVGKKKGLFKWKKFGMPVFSKRVGEVDKIIEEEEEEEEEEAEREVGFGRQTPMDMKTSLVKIKTPHKWRKSMY